MSTWLIAQQICYITDEHGQPVIKRPGAWFQVGRQRAQEMIAAGEAKLSPHVTEEYKRQAFALDNSGILLTGESAQMRAVLKTHCPGIPVEVGKPELLWPRTLILDPDSPIRPQLIAVGFHRLNRGWQVAAPLWKYSLLARDIGSDDDRKATQAVIHDLRVPVYDVRAIFIRRCGDTRKLMRLWAKESGHPQHQFMRALYRAKPVMCALPNTWMQG